MRIKLIALPLMVMAMADTASAASGNSVIPSFSVGNLQISAPLDYTFDQTGLNGSFTKSGTDWTLNISGTGTGAFYIPSGLSAANPGVAGVDTITNSAYNLNATFDALGNFTGGTATIGGTLASQVSGVNASTGYTYLYSATLDSMKLDPTEAAIGFGTTFQANGWSSQSLFTGGSSGDVIYLFNQGGVLTGVGPLSGLINQFLTGHFAAISSFSGNVESLAAVPLPMPAVLFGTGLTALLGLGRKRRNQANSI
jgi:hypothetical protein